MKDEGGNIVNEHSKEYKFSHLQEAYDHFKLMNRLKIGDTVLVLSNGVYERCRIIAIKAEIKENCCIEYQFKASCMMNDDIFFFHLDDIGSTIFTDEDELSIKSDKCMTNFEKIKQMDIDEMAKFLFASQFGNCAICTYRGKECSGNYFDDKSCVFGIIKWLESEEKL